MNSGRVVQVNVGLGGVPKTRVPRLRVTATGVEGDRERKPDRAVLVIAREELDALAKEGFTVEPGTLGENITLEGVDVRACPPGTRFRVGDVVLRVTIARKPCHQIEVFGTGIGKRIYNARVHAGDATDAIWGVSGLMCAVDAEGEVAPGDVVEVLQPESS